MTLTATNSAPINLRFKEWETRSPDHRGGEALRGVRLTSAARELARELTKSRQLSVVEGIDGIEIRAMSYIGRIELDPVVITIEPKIPGPELLSLFRYAYGLRNLKLSSAVHYDTGGSLFLDLLVAQLHAETLELFERGLRRQYVPKDEDLAAPRGRIDIQAIATRGGLQTGVLPCRHFPRSEDCLLNQVLLAGLKLGARVATDRHLVRQVRRLEKQIEQGVTSAVLTGSLLNSAQRSINRLVRAYGSLISIIEILFSSEQASLERDTGMTRLPGFLFDMNRFFQTLLDRFLKENLVGGEFRSEYGITHMYHYVTGANPRGRRSPRPRPDFAVLKGNKVKAILDAKYKDLWNNAVPRDILYQLTLYALSNDLKESTILYPSTEPGVRDQRISFDDPITSLHKADIIVRPVDLMEMESIVSNGTIDHMAAQDLARRLVGEW